MRRLSLLLALLLSLVAFTAAPARAAYGSASVSGNLVDAKTGAPFDSFLYLTLTDDEGNFRDGYSNGSTYYLEGLVGSLTLAWTDVNGYYQDGSVHVDLREFEDRTLDLQLDPKAMLRGHLTSTSGAPIEGLCPTAYVGDPDDAISLGPGCTDANGDYGIPISQTATVKVLFRDQDGRFANLWWQNGTSAATATPIEVDPSTDVTGIDAVLTPASTLTGSVKDDAGRVIAACLTAFDSAGTFASNGCSPTDENGNPVPGPIVVRGLGAGTYTVEGRAIDRAYLTRWLGGAPTRAGSSTVKVGTAKNKNIGSITTPLGGKISGKVVDAVTGAPVSRVCATVTAQDARMGGPSDYGYGCDETTPGSFTIVGLEKGSYPVEIVEYYRFDDPEAAAPTHATTWLPNKPDSRGATRYAVKLGKTVDVGTVRMLVGGTLSGRLTLADGSAPPQFMCLVAFSAATHEQVGSGGCADEQGDYTLTQLGTNDYKVQLYDVPEGYTTRWYGGTSFADARAVSVTAGRNTPGVDFTL